MTVNQGGVGLKTGSTPFKWNAAGGYQHIPFTGLYHVGAREYDPRTARWLQRDPIGIASGDPNLYRYCGNDAVNLSDPSGTGPLEAIANLLLARQYIFLISKQMGIQPELVAGVVFVEGYSSGINGLHLLNRAASCMKFLAGQPASLGMTQFTLDPRRLGLAAHERWSFIESFESNTHAQIFLAAQHLRELAMRPNRFPDRIGRLNRYEMAIILTEYNKGATESSAVDAKPGPYGRIFLDHIDAIKDVLYKPKEVQNMFQDALPFSGCGR